MSIPSWGSRQDLRPNRAKINELRLEAAKAHVLGDKRKEVVLKTTLWGLEYANLLAARTNLVGRGFGSLDSPPARAVSMHRQNHIPARPDNNPWHEIVEGIAARCAAQAIRIRLDGDELFSEALAYAVKLRDKDPALPVSKVISRSIARASHFVIGMYARERSKAERKTHGKWRWVWQSLDTPPDGSTN